MFSLDLFHSQISWGQFDSRVNRYIVKFLVAVVIFSYSNWVSGAMIKVSTLKKCLHVLFLEIFDLVAGR